MGRTKARKEKEKYEEWNSWKNGRGLSSGSHEGWEGWHQEWKSWKNWREDDHWKEGWNKGWEGWHQHVEKPVEDKQQQSIAEKDPDEEMPICGFTLSRVPWQQGRDGADAEKQVETDDIDEEAIKKYIETVPRDSFSQRVMTERLAIECEQDGEMYVAKYFLPAACPLRGTYQSDSFRTEISARRNVCAKIVADLRKEGLLDSESNATKVLPALQPEISCPLQCPPQMSLECLEASPLKGVLEWPSEIVLNHITLVPGRENMEGGSVAQWMNFGCLSGYTLPAERPGFALQFELGEGRPAVRIEPKVISWPPSAGATAHIQVYNDAVLPDWDEALAIVPLIQDGMGWEIDWERICGVSSEGKKDIPPEWLHQLCQRIVILQRLEQLGRIFAPIGPVPNPLRMEAVMGGGHGWGAQAFQVLCLQGEKALKMLFAVTAYVEYPYDDAGRLSQRVQASMDATRLASLVANSGLLAEVIPSVDWLPRLAGVEPDTAVKMLFALVGAYAGEKGGDFYSVVKLWEWLTADEQKATRGDEKSDTDELKTSNRYVDSDATKYKGRTPTYERFSQVVDPEDGTPELHVKYEKLGVARYRRADVQKKRDHSQYEVKNSPEKGWMDIHYDHRQATYVWRAFQVLDDQNNYLPAALPNKVQCWLRGTSAAALINFKRCGSPTLTHESLCEKKDGSLHVQYQCGGLFRYTRCPQGGLGFEESISPEKGESCKSPIWYSENPGEKTLLSEISAHSDSQEGAPLPNKVTEWLMTGKSLFQIGSVVAANASGDDVKVTSEHEADHITWISNAEGDSEHWKCCREHVGCAIIFVAGKLVENEFCLEELIYKGQAAETENGTVMPERVIKWMKKHPERKCDERVFKEYIEQQRKRDTPLCTLAPLQMQGCFPELPSIDLGHVEKALHHSFSNRMLLAEALLHSTGKHDSMTPDFQRLAFVGNAVAEQLVTRILVESAQFSTCATLSRRDKLVDASTFAVGPNASLEERNLTPEYEWPQEQKGVSYGADWPAIDDIDLSSPEKFRKVYNACCNNVAYARTCVELGLYKGMLQGSKDLSRSIHSFVKAVARSKEDESAEKGWMRLLRHDAPRAIGNVFIACLGATIMDGAQGVQEYSYLDARKVLVQHIKDGKDMPVMEVLPDKKENQSDGSWEMLKDLLKDGDNTLDGKQLAPPPPLCVPWGTSDPIPVLTVPAPPKPEEEQLHAALTLTDVHCCYVDDDALTFARSPRTALLRVPYMDMPREDYNQDDESTEDDADETNGPPENGAAKYCPDCEMWLNGPIQWEDHKIGKKHKKNVKKGGPSKTPASSKAKAKAEAKQPPEEAAGESPEAEEAMTTPAAMEDVNQQYGYLGGWPPPQYGYPGGWAPSQYDYPGGWALSQWNPGYHCSIPGYPSYGCYLVPHPPLDTSDEILPQAH